MGSKLVHFEVLCYPGARVIGRSARMREPAAANDTTIEDLWAGLARDGSLAFLKTLPGRLTVKADQAGWMGDWRPEEGWYIYLAGMLYAPGTPVPEGFAARDILAGEMAYGRVDEIVGEQGGELHAAVSEHVGRARDAAGYTYDGSRGLFEMEVYTAARFYQALEQGAPLELDFYTPCKRRA